MRHALERSNDNEDRIWGGLRHLAIELTIGCNLKCIHCYAMSDAFQFGRDLLSRSAYENLIREAKLLGCQAIQFIGGEPTLNQDLPDLVVYAHEAGYNHIEVYTNGTHLTDSLLAVLRESDVSIAFSFYSLYESVHDTITQTPGSFRKTVAGIRKAIEAGVPLRAGVVKMQNNQEDISETVNYLKRLGVRHVGVDRVRGVGRGQRDFTGTGIDELCHSCWKGHLAISSDGNTYPCVFAREFPLGNVCDQPLGEILRGSALKRFRFLSYDKHRGRKANTKTCEPSGECRPEIECDPCHPTNVPPEWPSIRGESLKQSRPKPQRSDWA